MISVRYFFLFGLVLLVDAANIVPAEEEFDFENAREDYFDNYNGGSLRVRRDAEEKETSDKDKDINTADGAGPRLNGESGECVCPPPPPPPHGHPPHHHPCHGLSRSACRERMAPPPYNGPACELRPLFRLPSGFNMTARRECFDKWEKPAMEAKGFDFSKPPHDGMHPPFHHRTLILNKGCDTQCWFLENDLVVEDEAEATVTISKEGVMATLKEEDDPQELVDAYGEHIDKCIAEAGELVHPKQSCKSGADEFLACLRHSISISCPGGKWKGNKACTDIEDSPTKMRDCRREQRAMFMTFMQRFPRGPKDFRF